MFSVPDVSVKLTLPGKSDSLTSSLKVKVNQYASLDCLAAGAGQDSLQWFLADVKKDATGESEKTETVTKSNIKFRVTSDHNGKEIRCDVVNLAGSASSVVASANLGIEGKIYNHPFSSGTGSFQKSSFSH